MKKEFTNADIITIFDILNNMKGRADIVPGDADIFWANSVNIETFGEKAKQARKIMEEMINSHFTEENSHVNKDEKGNEVRVINDKDKEVAIKAINEDLAKINSKTCELDIETFSKEAFKKMIKANEKNMTYLEMTVMKQFIEKDDE